jgi:ATP-binding cassette subfamily F protein 3
VQRPVGRTERDVRKDLKNIEKAVAQLDEQKQAVNARYMQASDPADSLRLHGELATVTAQLSDAEERWMQLQEELEALG